MAGNHCKSLLHLNDDCLLDILQRLGWSDLSRVADVCSVLKKLARMVFATKFKEHEIIISSARETNNCLRNFGSLISSLTLKPGESLEKAKYKAVLKSLVQNCSGMLTQLELHGFTFEKGSKAVKMSQSLLNGLKRLELVGCAISVKWFVNCPELVELVLIDTHVTYNGLQYQTCRKLELLKVNGSFPWVKKGLNLFLQQNNQLKSFEVHPFKEKPKDYLNGKHLPYTSILAYVPSTIEQLTVKYFFGEQITRFQSLKKLRAIGSVNYLMLKSQFHQLTNECLELFDVDMKLAFLEEETLAISSFRNLKTLKLNVVWVYGDHIVNLVKNLNQLSELHVGCFANQLDASNLLSMIQHANNLEHLILSFLLNRKFDLIMNRNIDVLESPKSLQINAASYQKMLKAVSSRSNGKRLNIIIAGFSSEISGIGGIFSKEAALNITCLPNEIVGRILCIELNDYIKFTDENLKVLRKRGFLP